MASDLAGKCAFPLQRKLGRSKILVLFQGCSGLTAQATIKSCNRGAGSSHQAHVLGEVRGPPRLALLDFSLPLA